MGLLFLGTSASSRGDSDNGQLQVVKDRDCIDAKSLGVTLLVLYCQPSRTKCWWTYGFLSLDWLRLAIDGVLRNLEISTTTHANAKSPLS